MSALQGALAVLLACAVVMLLINMMHVLSHEDAGVAQAVSDQRLERKLKSLLKQSAKMDEQLEQLLAATEALQGHPKTAVADEHSVDHAADADLGRDEADEAAPLAKKLRKRKARKATAAAAAATAAATAAVAHAEEEPTCPGRRPYHTVLTATGSNYQQWQARIMYYHWKKQAAAGGPCTDMAAFTRLCATNNGKPDGLQDEIPTLFTVELSREVINAHFGFGVLNRPNSIKQLMESEWHLIATECYLIASECESFPRLHLSARVVRD